MISIMGMTQANLHRMAKAMSSMACIESKTQYKVAMEFINDRKLGDLFNTRHCTTIQKLDDLEDYSNENRQKSTIEMHGHALMD